MRLAYYLTVGALTELIETSTWIASVCPTDRLPPGESISLIRPEN